MSAPVAARAFRLLFGAGVVALRRGSVVDLPPPMPAEMLLCGAGVPFVLGMGAGTPRLEMGITAEAIGCDLAVLAMFIADFLPQREQSM